MNQDQHIEVTKCVVANWIKFIDVGGNLVGANSLWVQNFHIPLSALLTKKFELSLKLYSFSHAYMYMYM